MGSAYILGIILNCFYSGTGAKTMHTLSPVQLRHPAFKDLLPVLARAQLLLCFGFFAAEVSKVGFGLGQWHHTPFVFDAYWLLFLLCGPPNGNIFVIL